MKSTTNKISFWYSLVVALSLCACVKTTYRTIDPEFHTLIYDFTKYTKKGFMFTPEEYRGEYESIGLLDLSLFARMEQTQQTIEKAPVSSGKWGFEAIATAELIELAYQRAKDLGADAVTNLKINDTLTKNKRYDIEVPGVRLTGFAIKRK